MLKLTTTATYQVSDFVTPFNEDGRTFIRTATSSLLNQASQHTITLTKKRTRTEQKQTPNAPPEILKTYTQPRYFAHYVMNLPATAITFLPSFIGLYSPSDKATLQSLPGWKLPMIHVYCFSTKSDDNVREGIEICEEVSRQIGFEITPRTPETKVWDVRDVAPKKRMFCCSFRLPEEVAFREV